MRMARVNDNWRHVYKNKYPTRLERLSYENVLGLGAGEIRFSGGITAICGTNGVGKSSLLDCLLGLLTSSASPESTSTSLRISNATLQATAFMGGQSADHRARWVDGKLEEHVSPLQASVIRIDPAEESLNLSADFRTMKNIEELLESVEADEADAADLRVLSGILGRNYTSWNTYEVETSPDVFRPYFRVEYDGSTYGVETMGAGEIAVMFVLWSVKRAAALSILLIDEPECLIPPRSQIALMNHLAKCSADRKLWIVITTHAPGIISNVPPEHIWRLVKVEGSVKAVRATASWEPLADLGIEPQKRLIVLTEDRFSREFCRVWLHNMDHAFARECHFSFTNGTEGIINALKHYPDTDGVMSIIGLFDGDFAQQAPTGIKPYAFLPGSVAPEVLVKQGLNADLEHFSETVGVSVHTLQGILARLEGCDHHDWVEQLAEELGRSYDTIAQGLCMRWLHKENNRIVAETAFQSMCKALCDSK